LSHESEHEFSSIFVFRVKNRSDANATTTPDLDSLKHLLIDKAFKFESDNYQPGFAKPTVFDRKILLVPYYEIAEEQITEDITDKEKPGEVISQTKTVQVQKLRYVIDDNIYTNRGLILICKVDTIDRAQQILEEYLQTIGFDRGYIYNFVYGISSAIIQQLLLTLYDYWSTTESQVISVKIGGKTISARYSGRGMYDVRLEDVDEEIRSRITAGEQIESITIKPPIAIAGGGIKIRRAVPKITINEIGAISCRANTNYENFALIKGFMDETIKIINDTLKGKHPRAYTRLDDFNTSDTQIQGFLPTGGGMSQDGAAITGEKREI
jgi:hypothetical protein